MFSNAEQARLICALVLATIIALRGRRSKSLSPTGAIAAFVVGFISWLCSVRFGITLIGFYLVSTRATRYKSALKRKLEDGYTTEGGNRSAFQVFASSLPAVFIAMLYFANFRHDSPITPTFPLRGGMLLMYLLFFASCAGDTFASELGIVMPKGNTRPVLITVPWRRVPRGTNGGISLEGTLASALGGLAMGLIYFFAGPEWSISQCWLVFVGILGGVVGSAVDSLLGALFQASWVDTESGKVLKDAPEGGVSKGRYVHICGNNLLNGEMVNTIAAVITTGLAPALLPLFRVPQ